VGKALQNALRAIEAANPGRLDGIFGDAPWTNKERLPDVTLKNLLEHFSGHTLSLANVPEDELGNGYEFLIKKFADDSGHTAQEFYTNRTVVHLMVQMLDPKPGESIYDPTCGTGGMLISALAEVKRKGGEHRTLKLFGQERNHMTASIARMNLVLHGVEDSEIARGDTLARPPSPRQRPLDLRRGAGESAVLDQAVEPRGVDDRPVGPELPRHAAAGPRGLRFLPAHPEEHGPEDGALRDPLPARRALSQGGGRAAPKLVEADLVDCVLGLGPNLFYNSPMEACVVFCRSKKPPKRRGRCCSSTP
jgi:type I restriction enzyme M protein